MKYLFLLVFLVNIPLLAQSDGYPMSAEEIDLERQRIQLERERIELEKQKLELEKMRLQTNQAPPTQTQNPAPAPIRPVKKKNFSKDLYLGFDYVIYDLGVRSVTVNGTTAEDENFAINGSGVKFGFGTPDENRVELFYYNHHLAFETYDNDWDVTMYGIDYLFVYYEYWGKNTSPYIKVGLASAQSDNYIQTLQEMGYTVDSDKSTITGSGLRLGLGLFLQIDEEFEVSLGLDSSGIQWQELMLSNATSSYKIEIYDSIGTYFFNINYFF